MAGGTTYGHGQLWNNGPSYGLFHELLNEWSTSDLIDVSSLHTTVSGRTSIDLDFEFCIEYVVRTVESPLGSSMPPMSVQRTRALSRIIIVQAPIPTSFGFQLPGIIPSTAVFTSITHALNLIPPFT